MRRYQDWDAPWMFDAIVAALLRRFAPGSRLAAKASAGHGA
jgi:hypothetical protein